MRLRVAEVLNGKSARLKIFEHLTVISKNGRELVSFVKEMKIV
jgi:hypothetical protein